VRSLSPPFRDATFRFIVFLFQRQLMYGQAVFREVTSLSERLVAYAANMRLPLLMYHKHMPKLVSSVSERQATVFTAERLDSLMNCANMFRQVRLLPESALA